MLIAGKTTSGSRWMENFKPQLILSVPTLLTKKGNENPCRARHHVLNRDYLGWTGHLRMMEKRKESGLSVEQRNQQAQEILQQQFCPKTSFLTGKASVRLVGRDPQKKSYTS